MIEVNGQWSDLQVFEFALIYTRAHKHPHIYYCFKSLFWCSTPDYITPDVPPAPNCSDYDKVMLDKMHKWFFFTSMLITSDQVDVLLIYPLQEHFSCPKSPEKLKTVKSKRHKQGKVDNGILIPCTGFSTYFSLVPCTQQHTLFVWINLPHGLKKWYLSSNIMLVALKFILPEMWFSHATWNSNIVFIMIEIVATYV